MNQNYMKFMLNLLQNYMKFEFMLNLLQNYMKFSNNYSVKLFIISSIFIYLLVL